MSSVRIRGKGHRWNRTLYLNFVSARVSTRSSSSEVVWNLRFWRHGPRQPGLSDTAGAGKLYQLTSRGRFQPQPVTTRALSSCSWKISKDGVCTASLGKSIPLPDCHHSEMFLFFISTLNLLLQSPRILLPRVTVRTLKPSSWQRRDAAPLHWGLLASPPEAISFSKLNKTNSINFLPEGKCSTSPPF